MCVYIYSQMQLAESLQCCLYAYMIRADPLVLDNTAGGLSLKKTVSLSEENCLTLLIQERGLVRSPHLFGMPTGGVMF